MFDRKTILITGGTGSFGGALLVRLLATSCDRVIIFSRDEKKQDDMRRLISNDKVGFHVGDVRDRQSVDDCMRGVDYVFHAAALKQVPSCEFFPMQALQTNVIGTQNVLDSAVRHGVEKVVCLSTDKAVYPINAMGMTKALMEKVAVAKARNAGDTTICVTRYGNVLCSRGSVVPLFIQQLTDKKPVTITDPKMTRFIMTLDEAIDLVLFAFMHGEQGALYVQKSPSTNIVTLAKAVASLLGKQNFDQKIIGTRHGEKAFEVLLSKEEMAKALDLGEYFQVLPDNRQLNYESYFSSGNQTIDEVCEYSSISADALSVEETLTKLNSAMQNTKSFDTLQKF